MNEDALRRVLDLNAHTAEAGDGGETVGTLYKKDSTTWTMRPDLIDDPALLTYLLDSFSTEFWDKLREAKCEVKRALLQYKSN